METTNIPLDSPLCLICSSVVISPDIKVESNNTQDDGGDKSVFIFLLRTLLEIPETDIVQQAEKINNWQLNILYCETCTKLIYSAKAIYTQVLELTQKFRKVQKQIVDHVLNSEDLQCRTTSTSSPNVNCDGILDFCRNFLEKHDFNEFGYPLVVNEIPSSLPNECKEEESPLQVDKVKEEPISESEEDYYGVGEDNEDQDYIQDSEIPSADKDNQTESDSDFEPAPPPKKTIKKSPIKKSPSSSSSSSQKKGNRKSPSSSAAPTTTSTHPRRKYKLTRPIKLSKFDIRYPNYPKRIRDPITKKFHCSEPSCSKSYPRKTRLETHVMIEHLQDNNFKCEEPLCGKSYANIESYQDHVSWHAGIPRWKCEEKVTKPEGGTMPCPEAYFDRRKLVRHVQKIHQCDNPFICELCGSKFSCQDYLTGHKNMKHSEKGKSPPTPTPSTPQICDYCGKSMSSKANLLMHINLVHEKTVGKFPCQFCERKFVISTHLKEHMYRKHNFSLEGYQPKDIDYYRYQCNVFRCKMNFVKEETWKKHMEEKHGQGKEGVHEFNCKFCGKGFHIRWKLEYHEEAHENKESKPFSCEICGNRFARLPYLKIHKKNIHKIPMMGGRTSRKKKRVN